MKRSLSTPAFLSCAFILLCSYEKSKKDSDKLNERAANPYDVIIVPGVPYGETSLKTILKARLLWAKFLYERGITKNIIFSGSAVYTPYIEGRMMKIYADSLGIPAHHTFAEEEAEHSTENIYYSVQMARKLGFKRIAIATDRYQELLIRSYVKKFFPEVEFVTVSFKRIDLNSPLPEIDAEPAYADLFVSLVERENRIKRFKGTMGKNIVESVADTNSISSRIPVIVQN